MVPSTETLKSWHTKQPLRWMSCLNVGWNFNLYEKLHTLQLKNLSPWVKKLIKFVMMAISTKILAHLNWYPTSIKFYLRWCMDIDSLQYQVITGNYMQFSFKTSSLWPYYEHSQQSIDEISKKKIRQAVTWNT
jgi:hypothetical protein